MSSQTHTACLHCWHTLTTCITATVCGLSPERPSASQLPVLLLSLTLRSLRCTPTAQTPLTTSGEGKRGARHSDEPHHLAHHQPCSSPQPVRELPAEAASQHHSIVAQQTLPGKLFRRAEGLGSDQNQAGHHSMGTTSSPMWARLIRAPGIHMAGWKSVWNKSQGLLSGQSAPEQEKVRKLSFGFVPPKFRAPTELTSACSADSESKWDLQRVFKNSQATNCSLKVPVSHCELQKQPLGS